MREFLKTFAAGVGVTTLIVAGAGAFLLVAVSLGRTIIDLIGYVGEAPADFSTKASMGMVALVALGGVYLMGKWARS